MHSNSKTLSLLVAVAAVGLTASLALAHGGDATKIHACVKNSNPGKGNIRIVGADSTCSSSETPLDWNIQGIQGAPGTPGAPGPQGPAGPAGPPAALSCPDGTTLFTGVCIENTAREPATWGDATRNCAAEGRRLPSGGELHGFRELPGITIAEGGEWTDDLGDVTLLPSFVFFSVSQNGNGVQDAFEPNAYRCVAGLLQ